MHSRSRACTTSMHVRHSSCTPKRESLAHKENKLKGFHCLSRHVGRPDRAALLPEGTDGLVLTVQVARLPD